MAKKKTMSTVDWVSFVLVIIGALNWGLIGLANFNLVNAILSSVPALERIVYILIGLSAVYAIYVTAKKH